MRIETVPNVVPAIPDASAEAAAHESGGEGNSPFAAMMRSECVAAEEKPPDTPEAPAGDTAPPVIPWIAFLAPPQSVAAARGVEWTVSGAIAHGESDGQPGTGAQASPTAAAVVPVTAPPASGEEAAIVPFGFDEVPAPATAASGARPDEAPAPVGDSAAPAEIPSSYEGTGSIRGEISVERGAAATQAPQGIAGPAPVKSAALPGELGTQGRRQGRVGDPAKTGNDVDPAQSRPEPASSTPQTVRHSYASPSGHRIEAPEPLRSAHAVIGRTPDRGPDGEPLQQHEAGGRAGRGDGRRNADVSSGVKAPEISQERPPVAGSRAAGSSAPRIAGAPEVEIPLRSDAVQPHSVRDRGLVAAAPGETVGQTSKLQAPAAGVQPAGVDLATDLAAQIRIQVRAGVEKIQIQLRPESLGRLEIKAEAAGGALTARINTESSAVREYLEANLSVLKQSLSDQGLKVDRIEVALQESFDPRQFSGSQHFSGDPRPRPSGDRPGAQRNTGGPFSAAAETVVEIARTLGPYSTFRTVA